VLPDTTTVVHRELIVALATQNRLPAVYPFRLFVDAGGLMAYGIDVAEAYETVVNLKTATAIGLDVPPTLLVRSPHNVCCALWQKRLTEARIWSADLVHLKGLGFWLCRSMKERISASSCLTEV
jgi:hypothetical protein